MADEADHKLQAAHMLISELIGMRLDLTSRVLALESELARLRSPPPMPNAKEDGAT
jgi:hypothetical protein